MRENVCRGSHSGDMRNMPGLIVYASRVSTDRKGKIGKAEELTEIAFGRIILKLIKILKCKWPLVK